MQPRTGYYRTAKRIRRIPASDISRYGQYGRTASVCDRIEWATDWRHLGAHQRYPLNQPIISGDLGQVDLSTWQVGPYRVRMTVRIAKVDRLSVPAPFRLFPTINRSLLFLIGLSTTKTKHGVAIAPLIGEQSGLTRAKSWNHVDRSGLIATPSLVSHVDAASSTALRWVIHNSKILGSDVDHVKTAAPPNWRKKPAHRV